MTNRTNLTSNPRFLSAVQLHTAGELEKAEPLYSELIGEFPDDTLLLQRFSQILLQRGKFREAIPYLNRCITLDTANSGLYCALGNALYHSGNSSAAISSFQTALKYEPNLQRAHLALSQLTLPGEHYNHTLKRFHQWLKPATYVEIGVETGNSMRLAAPPTLCVGIDPHPKISFEFSAPTKIFSETSDDFFDKYNLRKEIGDRPVELAFIDGLHHFEAALKDFINIERYSSPDTVVLLHDCIPLDAPTATRERTTTFWSGDTWKIIPCLKHYRPDLSIITLASPPTGLAVVTNLNPESSVLTRQLNEVIEQYINLEYRYLDQNKYQTLNVTFDDWEVVKQRIRKI